MIVRSQLVDLAKCFLVCLCRDRFIASISKKLCTWLHANTYYKIITSHLVTFLWFQHGSHFIPGIRSANSSHPSRSEEESSQVRIVLYSCHLLGQDDESKLWLALKTKLDQVSCKHQKYYIPPSSAKEYWYPPKKPSLKRGQVQTVIACYTK